MSARNLWMGIVVISASTWIAGGASAQQVTVTTPMQSVSDRFYESTNVGWSFGVRSGPKVKVFGRFGSPAAAAPPFGGFDPNAGLRSGFAVRNKDFGARFGFNFAQGSQRSFTTTAPTITLTNGVPGFLFNGRQVPFVTGVVPVLGFGGALPPGGHRPSDTVAARVLRGELKLPGRRRGAALQPAQASDEPAERAQPARPPSVITAPPGPSTLRRQRQAQQAANLERAREYFQRGQKVEASGKPQVAKHFYRLAARYAGGELKQTILKRLASVEGR